MVAKNSAKGKTAAAAEKPSKVGKATAVAKGPAGTVRHRNGVKFDGYRMASKVRIARRAGCKTLWASAISAVFDDHYTEFLPRLIQEAALLRGHKQTTFTSKCLINALRLRGTPILALPH